MSFLIVIAFAFLKLNIDLNFGKLIKTKNE